MMSVVKAAVFLVVGAAAGALLGYANQCAGGTCPLLCIWWRGALFGAIAGLALFFARTKGSARPKTGVQENSTPVNPRSAQSERDSKS
jgi:hypothetical protein